jgi:hypothetical protein
LSEVVLLLPPATELPLPRSKSEPCPLILRIISLHQVFCLRQSPSPFRSIASTGVGPRYCTSSLAVSFSRIVGLTRIIAVKPKVSTVGDCRWISDPCRSTLIEV